MSLRRVASVRRGVGRLESLVSVLLNHRIR